MFFIFLLGMIGELSFSAHLLSSSGIYFCFNFLRSSSLPFSGVSWSLTTNTCEKVESETFVESLEETPNLPEVFGSEKREFAFSCRNIHGCDYINCPFEWSSDAFSVGEYCTVDFSVNDFCHISILSHKQTKINLFFCCSKEKVILLEKNDFCGGRVTGSVSYSSEVDELTGFGWVSRDFLCSSVASSTSSPNFVLYGVTSSGESFRVSTLKSSKDESSTLFSLRSDSSVLDGSCEMTSSVKWTSVSSFQSYPLEFNIDLLPLELYLTVRVCQPYSEFYSVFSDGLGQACSTFTGIFEKKPLLSSEVSGIIVCFGSKKRCIEDMMRSVGDLVKEELQRNLLKLDTDRFTAYNHKAIYAPIENLVNAGGKSWRSFLFCVLCSFWGSQNLNYIRFSQIVEILHVGSLIIDDIEDSSTTRRGCPCAHTLVGVPLAINSGCTCYFLALKLAQVDSLPPEKCLKIYQLTIETLRLGHIGQGLDIFGTDSAVFDAFKSENFDSLLSLIECIHSRKSGEFVGFVCKLACILSDAPENVIEPISLFGKNIGIAFQIVDDVLNVTSRSYQKFAEDIRNGKITYPIAKALQLLPSEARENLYTKISSCPTDTAEISEILDILVSTDAILESKVRARKLVEKSWKDIEHVFPMSVHKKYLFGFCNSIIQRTL